MNDFRNGAPGRSNAQSVLRRAFPRFESCRPTIAFEFVAWRGGAGPLPLQGGGRRQRRREGGPPLRKHRVGGGGGGGGAGSADGRLCPRAAGSVGVRFGSRPRA